MPSRPSPTLTPNPRENQCLLPSIQVGNNGHPPVDSKRLPLGNEGHAQPTIAYLDPQSQGKPVPLPSIQVGNNGHPPVDSKRLPLGNEGHAQPTIAYLDPQSQGKPVPLPSIQVGNNGHPPVDSKRLPLWKQAVQAAGLGPSTVQQITGDVPVRRRQQPWTRHPSSS